MSFGEGISGISENAALTQGGAVRSDNNEAGETPYSDLPWSEESGQCLSIGAVPVVTFIPRKLLILCLITQLMYSSAFASPGAHIPSRPATGHRRRLYLNSTKSSAMPRVKPTGTFRPAK